MPSLNLTAAAVERLRPPVSGQVDYFDRGYPGLALRISHAGTRAWTYVYRDASGRVRRVTLGRHPQLSLSAARDEWRKARAAVDRGEKPGRQKPADADQFEAILAEWLRRDQGQNRTVNDVTRIMRHDVLPVFEGRPIGSIKRAELIRLIDDISDRAPVMARRVHAHLHRLFRWSLGRGLVESNPMADLPAPPAPRARDRVLSDHELRTIWLAASEVGYPFGPLTKLLLLTAARRDEVAGLRWSEVKEDRIEIGAERMKAGEAHTIPLASAARELIEGLPRFHGTDLVFTTNGRNPVSGWSKAKRILDREVEKIAGEPLVEWRLHDVRRTVATGLQRLGVRLEVTEEILAHRSGSRSGVTGIYQRFKFEDEKRAALEAWARHVIGVVSGELGSVVPFRGIA